MLSTKTFSQICYTLTCNNKSSKSTCPTHSFCSQAFEESQDAAGKPIPGFLCRVLSPQIVLLSMHDRAPQINVHEERLAMTGYKFYCSIRYAEKR